MNVEPSSLCTYQITNCKEAGFTVLVSQCWEYRYIGLLYVFVSVSVSQAVHSPLRTATVYEHVLVIVLLLINREAPRLI
jgi:hypothetical protein